ncbi:MAG: hypothetical protein KF821_06210 [Anaerolineales bacterium]|nr:hypothetical protein [Anaerolineales bacterium]
MADGPRMKVAFVFHRANYLKLYGPIIDAALQRGWQVECWLHDVPMGDKDYLRVPPELISIQWGARVGVRQFEQPADVARLNEQVRPNAIISLLPRSRYMAAPGHERFLTLQYNVDTFTIATLQEHLSSDYLCLYAPAWLDYAAQYYTQVSDTDAAAAAAQLADKVVYTGFPQMDVFAHIDREAVRARWAIPEGKKVVLALPLDLMGWPGVWPAFFQSTGLSQLRHLLKGRKQPGFVRQYWPWALKGWNDTALAEAIKQFAERNNAVLLLKGREKDPIREAWRARAFLNFYDEQHYPATVHEAIAIADACILFYSTAVQEAVYAGVPVVCIDRPNRDTVKHQLWRQAHLGGPYNFPGAVSWQSLPEAITTLPEQRLADLTMDAHAREEYLARYNGPADHRASERILDLVTA